jgi:hypothetical protein
MPDETPETEHDRVMREAREAFDRDITTRMRMEQSTHTMNARESMLFAEASDAPETRKFFVAEAREHMDNAITSDRAKHT